MQGHPDSRTAEALEELGYRVEDVSSWALVSDLLRRCSETELRHERDRQTWLARLDKQNELVERAQQDNLNLLAEIAGKLAAAQGGEADAEKHALLQRELDAAKQECARLASVVDFAQQQRGGESAAPEDSSLLQQQVHQLQQDNDRLKQQQQQLLVDSQQPPPPSLLLHDTQLSRELQLANLNLKRQLSQAQQQRDTAAAQLAVKSATVDELSAQLAVLKKHATSAVEQAHANAASATHAQAQVGELERQLAEERQLHSARLVQLRHAALDVEGMARESRELSAAQDRAVHDYRRAQAELDQQRTKLAQLAGQLDASRVERDELVAVYQKLCGESEANRALAKDAAQQLLLAQQRESQARHDLAELELALKEQTMAGRQLRVDVSQLDRTRDALVRELRQAEARLAETRDGQTIAQRLRGAESDKLFTALRDADKARQALVQAQHELGALRHECDRLREERDVLASSSKSRPQGAVAAGASSSSSFASSSSSLSLPSLPSFVRSTPWGGEQEEDSDLRDLLSEAGSVIRSSRIRSRGL